MNLKITVELPNALVERARKIAARDQTTLQNLVKAGLEQEIDRRLRTKPFKLRDGSFKGGKGLHPDVANLTWEQILDLSYGDRGGVAPSPPEISG